MQKAPNMDLHYSAVTAPAPARTAEVPVFQMPKGQDGSPRFPTRSDGAEAAVMRGAVATVKVTLG